MTMRASIHLPPKESSDYVRVELDGETIGYLRSNSYDVIYKIEAEFLQAMEAPGAEEESHSNDGRWVVRLRGESALAALYGLLAARGE